MKGRKQKSKALEEEKEEEPDREESEDEEYEVESILDERTGENGDSEFLTMWKGYEIEEATWVPESNHTAVTIKSFRRKKAAKRVRPSNRSDQYDDISPARKFVKNPSKARAPKSKAAPRPKRKTKKQLEQEKKTAERLLSSYGNIWVPESTPPVSSITDQGQDTNISIDQHTTVATEGSTTPDATQLISPISTIRDDTSNTTDQDTIVVATGASTTPDANELIPPVSSISHPAPPAQPAPPAPPAELTEDTYTYEGFYGMLSLT